jgi:hypothetical protein
MTYSIDYRKQVLSSIDNGMTIQEASLFYVRCKLIMAEPESARA